MTSIVNTLYTVLWIIFIHTDSSTEYQECVFKYYLGAALNFSFPVLRIVRLHGELLKILMLPENELFRKHEMLAFGLRRWCLFFVSILCADEFENFLHYLQ
jgi:hypothetical protein